MTAGQPRSAAGRGARAAAALLGVLLAAGCGAKDAPLPTTGPIQIVIATDGAVRVDGRPVAAADLVEAINAAYLRRPDTPPPSPGAEVAKTLAVLTLEWPDKAPYAHLTGVLEACQALGASDIAIHDAPVHLWDVEDWTDQAAVNLSDPLFAPINLRGPDDLDLLRERSMDIRGRHVAIDISPDAPMDLVLVILRTAHLAGAAIDLKVPSRPADLAPGVLVSLEPPTPPTLPPPDPDAPGTGSGSVVNGVDLCAAGPRTRRVRTGAGV
jgi:hypothetical protein